jgi:hypothetical protein
LGRNRWLLGLLIVLPTSGALHLFLSMHSFISFPSPRDVFKVWQLQIQPASHIQLGTSFEVIYTYKPQYMCYLWLWMLFVSVRYLFPKGKHFLGIICLLRHFEENSFFVYFSKEWLILVVVTCAFLSICYVMFLVLTSVREQSAIWCKFCRREVQDPHKQSSITPSKLLTQPRD